MKKLTNYIEEIKNDNRGIALLFTLGILGILLVVAVGFAMTAMTERSIASNNADITSARILAESALNRVATYMKSTYTDSSYVNPATKTFLKAVASGSHWNERHFLFSYSSAPETDWTCNLETMVNTDTMLSWDTDSTEFMTNIASILSWKNISVNQNGTDKIIGRVAYVVIDETGKLDPKYIAPKDTVAEGSSFYETRKGLTPDEINLMGTDMPAGLATDLDNADDGGDRLASTDKWFSREEIFKRISPNEAELDSCHYYIFPNTIAEDEIYWIDLDTNTQCDSSTELFHRFNLARSAADWDSIDTGVILDSPTLFSTSDSSTTNSGNGIGWLYNWDDAHKGSFDTGRDRAKQISANLIDYCDSDSIPTTNSTTDPTYTGLEKTPYINEIGVEVNCTATVTQQDNDIPPVTNQTRFKFDFECNIFCETIDLYNISNHSAVFTIEEGTLTYTWNKPDGTTTTENINLHDGGTPSQLTIPMTGSPNVYEYDWDPLPYKASWDNTSSWVDTGSAVTTTAEITNVTVQIKKASLYYNGVFADFSKPDNSGETSNLIATLVQQVGSGFTPKTHGWFSYQVDDPKQNLNPDDWDPAIGVVAADYATAGGTTDVINSTVDTTQGDNENVIPESISTNYIRNNKMETLWELGCIHRAGKWETINLKNFSFNRHGGGSYSAGDANILDQIKMTDQTKSYGKVNVNSPDEDVLKALVRNVKLGNNYDTPVAGGTAIDGPTSETIATSILGVNGSGGSQAFVSRAEIAKAAAMIPAGTDKAKEELIGKVVNLTSTQQNYFTIIALAQTIKDIGGIPFTKDLDGDGTIANGTTTFAKESVANCDLNGDGDKTDDTSIREIIATIPSQPATPTTQFNVYDQHADEILAEQKIMATFYRNAYTNEWKLLSYEYMDE